MSSFQDLGLINLKNFSYYSIFESVKAPKKNYLVNLSKKIIENNDFHFIKKIFIINEIFHARYKTSTIRNTMFIIIG